MTPLRRERRIGVQHIDLLAVRARRLEQRQPVGLVFRKRLLMPKDHMVGIVRKLSQSDEASPFTNLRRNSRRPAGAGHGIGLRIAIQRRRRFLAQNVFRAPLLQCPPLHAYKRCSPRYPRAGAAQHDANQVVGACVVIPLLHCGVDLVVGLRHDIGHVHSGGVVPESAKRKQTCHPFIVRRPQRKMF